MTPLPSADSSGNPVYSQSTTLKATIAAQGGQGCTATPGANTTSVTSSDASDFWTGVLNGLGAPVSTNNILVLNTWSSREAAPSWATWNPLDSTQGQGSPGNSSGVLAYSSQADGISYTWQTIDNPNYPAIKAALIADTDITIWQETSGGNGLIGTELMTWSNNGYSYLPASNPTFVSNALVNTTQVLSQPISSVDFTYDDGSGSSPIPLGTAAIVNGVGSYTLPLIYGGMFNSNSKGTITATYEDNSDWSGSSADWSSFVLDGCPTVCSTPLFSQSPTTYNMPVTITAFVTAGSPGTVTPGTPNELITGNNAGELAPVETISFYDGSPLVGNLLNAQQAYFAGDAIGGAPSGYNISPTQNIG